MKVNHCNLTYPVFHNSSQLHTKVLVQKQMKPYQENL